MQARSPLSPLSPLRMLVILALVWTGAGAALAQDEASAIPKTQDPLETETGAVSGGGGSEALPSDFLAPGMTDLPSFLDAMDAERNDSEELIDGIAAQVGNGVVLVSEVYRLAAPVEARMRRAGAPESEIRAMRAQALERLIESRIIDDMVERSQLSASEAEVNGAVAAIASENGLTLEQMSASIASHGLSLDEYRAKIKKEIERNKLLGSMIRSRVRVDESEVQALYRQRYADQRTSGSEVHLLHLLVASGGPGKPDEEAACRIVEEAREQIVSGATNFGEAAGRLSDANRESGGDLGWVHSDELASWMAPAVAGLEPGQVSQIVPMYFGCNLMQVVERRQVVPVTLAQARPELEEALMRRKMDEEYGRFIEKLRESIYIERKGSFAGLGDVEERSASR